MTGEQSSVEAPSGWYANPTAAGSLRWWDGRAWTDFVITQPVPPHRRPKHHFILTHARSAVLFVLTVIAVAVGIWLYPWWAGSEPAHAKSNIQEIDIVLDSQAQSVDAFDRRVDVFMESDGAGGTKLQFAGDSKPVTVSSVSVMLPPTTWSKRSTDCGADQPPGVTCSVSNQQKWLTYDAPADDQWVHIPKSEGAGWGATVSDEYASFLIPSIVISQADASGNTTAVQAVAYMHYHVTLKDAYTWATGTQPQDLTGGDPAWPVQTTSWSPLAENGTALVVRDNAERLIFMAGAVVGVGAAAFAAAIAELVGTSAKESKNRRQLVANTPDRR